MFEFGEKMELSVCVCLAVSLFLKKKKKIVFILTKKILGPQLLPQLAYAVSCEWCSKSSESTTPLLKIYYVNKL